MTVEIEKIVSLCRRRGFIFQSSEIYGKLGSIWDYGPLGVELKRNVKDAWWRSMVHGREDMYGLDAAILMHPKVWVVSGHAESFSDPFVKCTACSRHFRADQVLPKTACPNCGKTLPEKTENAQLMLNTTLGPVAETAEKVYLRPETAQGIFVNFANILDSIHPKLPFGVAQIGKAFRNEITPGNFIFRTREFEQMEIEYFVEPQDAMNWYEYWINERYNWYIGLGINKENLRIRPHQKKELAHYASACSDIEYNFPFGWSELEGIAHRGDFDLKQHMNASGKDLTYFSEENKTRFLPHIIEPSGGIDRSLLAFLTDSYREEKVRGDKRVVLGLHKSLAPIKVAVLPLLRNRSEIVNLAKEISRDLRKDFATAYDDTAGIGKLYRRQDEIGTFYCVTVDVQSLEDRAVTVRHRDTMNQERIPIDRLKSYLAENLR